MNRDKFRFNFRTKMKSTCTFNSKILITCLDQNSSKVYGQCIKSPVTKHINNGDGKYSKYVFITSRMCLPFPISILITSYFQALERYTKVANGYTCIGNVLDPEDTKPRDFMESYFMSETLKYLFLLFSPNRHLVDIDKVVMNSEAHPLPIYSY